MAKYARLPPHLVVAVRLMEPHQELAGEELVGVHRVQQLALGGGGAQVAAAAAARLVSLIRQLQVRLWVWGEERVFSKVKKSQAADTDQRRPPRPPDLPAAGTTIGVEQRGSGCVSWGSTPKRIMQLLSQAGARERLEITSQTDGILYAHPHVLCSHMGHQTLHLLH